MFMLFLFSGKVSILFSLCEIKNRKSAELDPNFPIHVITL